MKYHELLAHLDKELSGRCRVAVRPDHPFILSGPDLLAGGRGSLHALFIQKRGEQDRPNDLLTRLAQARLALPSNTACYLMLSPLGGLIERDMPPVGEDENLVQSDMHSIEHNFDRVFEFGDVSEVSAAIGGSHPEQRPELSKIRKFVFQRASILFSAALRIEKRTKQSPSSVRVFHEFQDKAKAGKLIVPSWSASTTRRARKFFEGEGVVATTASFTNKPAVRSVLKPIFDTGLRIDYSLENGIPYPHFKTVNTIAHHALMPGKDKMPKIAFNSLATETDLSEQKGLANLFVGMFGTFRNPTAHGPKISWPISEQDALDLLTLVSLLHRRLDAATPTGRKP